MKRKFAALNIHVQRLITSVIYSALHIAIMRFVMPLLLPGNNHWEHLSLPLLLLVGLINFVILYGGLEFSGWLGKDKKKGEAKR
ncbi:MAG: hypothetical protein LBN43_08485 [Oscillospiraceae bacterium]|nr:hypothetical protein [Oscillospiraceae bacterium]